MCMMAQAEDHKMCMLIGYNNSILAKMQELYMVNYSNVTRLSVYILHKQREVPSLFHYSVHVKE